MVECKRQRERIVETRTVKKQKVEAFVSPIQTISRPCDVFINHRGIDTKRNIGGLLHDHLSRLGLKPFMDCRNMKPGDNLSNEIDNAIRNCKVAVALLSPHYCESRCCLRELALIMESKKRVVPIFWDVKPSQLRVKNKRLHRFSAKELRRFGWALEKVKDTVGLTFNSFKGDWSEFLVNASNTINNSLGVEGQSISKDPRSKGLMDCLSFFVPTCSNRRLVNSKFIWIGEFCMSYLTNAAQIANNLGKKLLGNSIN